MRKVDVFNAIALLFMLYVYLVAPMSQQATPREAREAIARRAAKNSFEAFFRTVSPSDQYQFGVHTYAIMAELQAATEAVERGECYYVRIHVPPRHGKSDLVSRRYVPWHLLRNPDHEAILGSYNAELAIDLSGDSMRCFGSVAPMYGLGLGRQRERSWSVAGSKGRMHAAGLGGTITGMGAHILVIDDYCKNRREAESKTIRNTIADSFKNDCMTRLAPAHAVIILATRWHEDDLAGRIDRWSKEDSSFPQFKVVRFAAEDDKGNYLFTERFSREWYEMQKSMGTYSWQSLFQNDPKPRTGNLLRADKVKIIDKMPQNLHFRRGWDLASTEKERMSDDPDFTVGTKAAYTNRKLFIAGVERGQWEAPERNRRICKAALEDGPGVQQRIEVVAGYKDCYTTVKTLLAGKSVVKKVIPVTDKVANMSIFEPVFESGDVYLLRGAWNEEWLAEFSAFPSGRHDDQCDSLHAAVGDLVEERTTIGIERL